MRTPSWQLVLGRRAGCIIPLNILLLSPPGSMSKESIQNLQEQIRTLDIQLREGGSADILEQKDLVSFALRN